MALQRKDVADTTMLADDDGVMQSHSQTTLIPQSSAGFFSAPVVSRPLKRKATQLLPSERKRYLRRLSLRTCFDDLADNDGGASDVDDCEQCILSA